MPPTIVQLVLYLAVLSNDRAGNTCLEQQMVPLVSITLRCYTALVPKELSIAGNTIPNLPLGKEQQTLPKVNLIVVGAATVLLKLVLNLGPRLKILINRYEEMFTASKVKNTHPPT